MGPTLGSRGAWSRLVLLVGAVWFGMCTASASAQTGRESSIEGAVKDNTGANLPGVTVTLTSPALQVSQLVSVSDATGNYRFSNLPIGTYRLNYELSGFATLVREDIRLTVGFAARVDVIMQLAGVEETITVRGAGPLVDVSHTGGGTTITQEILSAIPTNLNVTSVYDLAGGITPNPGGLANQSLDNTVGASSLGANINNTTYGQYVRSSNWFEGIKTIQAEIPDLLATEEVAVKTYGNTAEVDMPGANLVIVYRSGGNQFHGRASGEFHQPGFAASNLDDRLRAQGISNKIGYLRRGGGELGGRIVSNKLWFFGAYQQEQAEKNITGFGDRFNPATARVEGSDVTPIERAWNSSYKVSYQASLTHRFTFFGATEPADSSDYLATRFIPHESSRYSKTYGRHHKVDWTAVYGKRLFVELLGAESGYKIVYRPHLDEPFTVCRFYRDVGIATGNGCSVSVSGAGGTVAAPWLDRDTRRKQISGSVSTYWASHDLKAGFIYLPGRINQQAPDAGIFNEYRLVYDRVAGGQYRPVEFWAADAPTESLAHQILDGAYVTDSWRPTGRLTVNLGLRWDRTNMFVDAGTKPQGKFGFSATFPRVEVGTWNGLAPRVGAAFDLFGRGKTVLKGTFGIYNHAEFNNYNVPNTPPTPYARNNPTSYAYRWSDQDGNNDYTPGEVNLDINGGAFIDVQGVSNNFVNPDLRWGVTRETTGSVEHELASTISIRALWVYKQVIDELQSRGFVNILRPYDVFNQVFTRRDPGPDGALNTGDDAGTIQVYDYDPAYRGAKFVANMIPNIPEDRTDWFHNFEIGLTKRPGSGKWFAQSSLLTTRYHRWIEAYASSPNSEYFPLDETWRWSYRINGGYQLPYGLMAAANYVVISGTPGQRTVIVRAADPDRGPSFPSSTAITLRVGEFGAVKTPVRHLMNFRLSKSFTKALRVDLNVFNLFNTNVAFEGNWVSGPTYGFITRIADPRVFRIGARLEF